MKKLILLLSIVFITINTFGQATGYNLSNFATSGSIGTASATVDVYSRININQTTPSITLTVPIPTNTSTKVVEVWIANKGTASFSLRPLSDANSFQLDTGKFVILKWIGTRYTISGGGSSGSVDLSNYIKRDGTSPATTGTIEIGDGYGFQDTSSVYSSRFVTSGIDFFKTDPFYFGSRPLRFYSTSTDYRSTFSLADDGYIFNTVNNFSGNTGYGYFNGNGFYAQNYTSGFSGSYFGLNTSGLYLQAQVGSGVTRSALIRTSLYTGSGSYTYELPDKGGTFAMISDITAGGISLTDLSATAPLAYNNTTGVFSMPAAATAQNGYLTSADWNTFNNKIGLASLSGTSGVSYNSGTGAISFNLGTSNTWTTQQIAPSWFANGTGGAGYMQLASQSTTPTAVSGSMILYSDASNRFSIVRRNNANSADITRTHLYPDGSYDWTFPTPASGSSSTLAGINTAQTFTQANTFSATNIFSVTQRFPSVGFTLNNGTSDLVAISAGVSNLSLGGGFTTINLKSVNVSGSTVASALGNVMTISTNQRTTAVNSDNVLVTTGTSNGAKSGDILISPSNASGGGTKGNVALLTTTVPTWNSGSNIFYVANRAAAPTDNPTSGYYMWGESGDATIRSSGGGITSIGTAGVSMQVAGQGLLVKEGTNATLGSATLTAGAVTISTTKVTANSRIFVTIQSPSGTLGTVYVSARTAGTSFTIASTSALDTSVVAWFIVEPN